MGWWKPILGVLCLAGVLGCGSGQKALVVPQPSILSQLREQGKGLPGQKSPVIIVGGSIHPYAAGGWTPCTAGSQTCYVTSQAAGPFNSLSLDGVSFDTSSPYSRAQASWAGLVAPWTLTFVTRDKTGAAANTGYGVQVCSSDNHGNCGAPSTFVAVSIKGKGPLWYYENLDSATMNLLRYWDPNYKPSPGVPNYLNHIWEIDVAGVDNCNPCAFHCIDGQCNVYIDSQ